MQACAAFETIGRRGVNFLTAGMQISYAVAAAVATVAPVVVELPAMQPLVLMANAWQPIAATGG